MSERTCSVDGCPNPPQARGWCPKHYQRWRRHGDAMHPGHPSHAGPVCMIEGCDRLRKARGWCQKHYQRWRAYGDPLHPMRQVGSPPMNIADRFWAKVAKGVECWEWTGRLDVAGYGRFDLVRPKRPAAAHRLAYELAVGPIPDGLHIDHLCRNRACVNPDHLEPVTLAENTRRGISYWRERTECLNGHPWDEANTYRHRGKRLCRACRAAARKGRYERDKRRRT